MKKYEITIFPDNITITARAGSDLLTVMREAGLQVDSPCGGKGTCKKCKVFIQRKYPTASDRGAISALACQTHISEDLIVTRSENATSHRILTGSVKRNIGLTDKPRTASGHYYQIGFDIGTTTVVGYLLDGRTGRQLSAKSMLNPQSKYGADVIGRADYCLQNGGQEMADCIRDGLNELTFTLCREEGIKSDDIMEISAVGNSCMQHLFLKLPVDTLVKAPYHPVFYDGYRMKAGELGLKANKEAELKILPNIGGFVGSDTVACMIAADYANLDKITLLIDIGTNGEVVLGNKDKRFACSTAAGPALEGAKITCGMRGAKGAVDHVFLKDGRIEYTTVDDAAPAGICGSGLIDLIATLVRIGIIDESGLLLSGDEAGEGDAGNKKLGYKQLGETDIRKRLKRIEGLNSFVLCETSSGDPSVYLTQKDVREVQLAKSAIASGIICLADAMEIQISDIDQAFIAGAFGNYMDIENACSIGLIPFELKNRFSPIGNAAGEGAKIVLLNDDEYQSSNALAKNTGFVELATREEFQDLFVDNLSFSLNA